MDRELSPRDRFRDRLRRLARPLLALALLGLAGAWGTGLVGPSVEGERLRIATVERAPLEVALRAHGVVQPVSEQRLTSPVATRLLRVLRFPGARVEAGDALLELDLSAARLDLEQLRRRLEQARLGRREARLEIEQERARLDTRRQVGELEQEEARFRLQQDRQLFTSGLTSQVQLRQSQTRERRLALELASLEAEAANASQAADAQLARLDAEIESLRGEIGQRQSELERGSARVGTAGVVTWVLDQEGAPVAAGDLLARWADLGTYRVEATVSDVHSDRLLPGAPVRLELHRSRSRPSPRADSSGPGSLEPDSLEPGSPGPGSAERRTSPRLSHRSEPAPPTGHIARILPSVDAGSVRFWVELDPSDERAALRPNQKLDVLVITDRLDDTLVLDKGPFASGPGEQEVFVLDADGRTARRRTVVLGLSGHRRWQVESGLRAGERVVVGDLSEYRHLEEIRIR